MIEAKKPEDQHSEEETQRRFEALVRTALSTPPKPMKDMPRKRIVAKPKPATAAKR